MKRVLPAPQHVPKHPERALVVSIVSHGHGALVQSLLHHMAQHMTTGTPNAPSLGVLARVVLTLNLPEPHPVAPPNGWPFVLDIRNNTTPLGFGANHNRALSGAAEAFVCILNPDVQLPADGPPPWLALVQTASAPNVGCAYPVQVDAHGRVQDSQRRLPTLPALWRRRVLGQPEAGAVEWVNGACMVLARSVWESINGFDERFFMYCEDVDLCLRLRLAGWTLAQAPVQLIHSGQRASRTAWRPLWWHVRSVLRLWASPVFWHARRLPGVVSSGADTIASRIVR